MTDNRFSKANIWKRLTFRGKIVFGVLILIGLTLSLQEYNNQLSSSNKDAIIKKENAERDSLITVGINAGVDSNRRKLFNDISEAFSKQGLRLDTLRKDVERIRDSAKQNITILHGSDPFFSLCKEEPITLKEETPDSYLFNLNLCNSAAPSRNLSAKVYVVSIDKTNRMSFSKEFELFQLNAQMDKDAIISQQIIVPTDSKLKICYFLIKGNWTNVDKSKTFDIDNIYHYNLETKRSGGITAINERRVRTFLNTVKGI